MRIGTTARLRLVSPVGEVHIGSAGELFSSMVVVLSAVATVGELSIDSVDGVVSSTAIVVFGLSPKAVNAGSGFESFFSFDVAPVLVSVVTEVNHKSGSGIITELGVINGISQ